MFTFDAIEKSLYNGISPDNVPDAIKSRFSMTCGCKELDNRLQVRLSEGEIQFFYYDDDYNANEWEVKNNDFVKEVGFITLTRRKDTGNDILAFPQNIEGLKILGTGALSSIKNSIKQWEAEFRGFPFVDVDLKENNEVDNDDVFRRFMQCCLLSFVYEFENRWQNFGASPLYDIVRDKLRESDVYKLLSAKIQYSQYLYKGYMSRNQEKYTNYTQKFVDYLMDKNFNKVIPPDIFIGSTEVRQDWFYNPEEELEHILETNREHECKKINEPVSNVATLKESLVSKIRKFLYTKHSVCWAMTSDDSKALFKFAQALMFVFNVFMVIALSNFDKKELNCFYEDFLCTGGSWVALVLFLIGISGWLNGRSFDSVINAFFPRIVVAEAAAWLTIGIAEDLVKSMLGNDSKIGWAMAAVILLVGILVFGEAKQHSPYLKRGENITKTILVLNHSFFFALVLGCIMQFVFYDNLLETSNVLSEVTYKEHFDNKENCLQKQESLEKAINDYQKFLQEYDMGSMSITGGNEGKAFMTFKVNDTTEIKAITNIKFQSSLMNSLVKENQIDTYHDKLVQVVNECREDLVKSESTVDMTTTIYSLSLKEWGEVVGSNSNAVKDSIRDAIAQENLQLIGVVLPDLRIRIQKTKTDLAQDDYETLLEWATVNFNTSENANAPKDIKCCRKVGRFNFYPKLLLMHTLIVLVLAFITRLIISDKSVTEPL